jgi:hypothetical protein
MTIWGRLSEHRRYRLLEMIPGILVWLTFAVAVLASLFWPVAVIGFVLVFDIYWFVRIIYLTIFVVAAYRRYRHALSIDWLARVKSSPAASSLWHLIMLPTAVETDLVLRQTLDALITAAYNPAQIIVVLAVEERSPWYKTDVYSKLIQTYGSSFGGLLLSAHPHNLPGEITGKGANIAWAGRLVKKWIDDRSIPYDDIVVTTIDADTIIHPKYLAYLAVTYASTPRPTRSSYQPIPLFHNNIWESLPWMRVVSYSTTFWLMGDTQRPDRLFTFSSHSMPWRALVDVDFWQNDVVSEDSRIFLQCLIRYDGDYSVIPMYLPVSMDVVDAPNWWQGMKNQYKQIRRWAYGAENFPFMAWNFAANKNMKFSTKLRYLYYQIEGNFSWAVATVLILILGWLPLHASANRLAGSVLAQNAPVILRWLMIAAMIGAVMSAFLCLLMLPKKPRSAPWYQWLFMVFQWLLLPVTMIFFGSIPAIESQTRLMFGKYLGFAVTDKHRHEPKTDPTKPGQPTAVSAG